MKVAVVVFVLRTEFCVSWSTQVLEGVKQESHFNLGNEG